MGLPLQPTTNFEIDQEGSYAEVGFLLPNYTLRRQVYTWLLQRRASFDIAIWQYGGETEE
jgi:hypothetical protein